MKIWYLYGIPPSTLSKKIELVDINKIKEFISSNSKLSKEYKSLINEIGGSYVTREKPKKMLVLGSGAKSVREI